MARVDQHPRADAAALATCGVFDRDVPDPADLPDLQRTGAGADFGAAIGGIARGEDDEARVIDKAVRILKTSGVAVGNQRTPDLVAGQIDRARRRQQVAAAYMVIEEQPEPQKPGRTQPGVVRQHESKRANDVRRDLPEDFALDQRFANQTKLVVLQIAQATMHELRRPGRRSARQIIHFTKKNGISPARCVARDATAVNAATNDSEVENPIQQTAPPGVRLFT
jgi:hypothetical protein